jgi:hypothetical protein
MGQLGANSLSHWPKNSPPNKGGDGDFCPPPSVHSFGDDDRWLHVGFAILMTAAKIDLQPFCDFSGKHP